MNNTPIAVRALSPSVSTRIATYRPISVPEAWWAATAVAVRNAVTASRPSSTQIATGHLNALVSFLASPQGWDPGTALDVAALITPRAIETFTASISSRGSRSRKRHALRTIGRALGVVPRLDPCTPANLTTVDPLVQAAGFRAISVAVLAAVVASDRGALPKALFDSFARANPQVSATAAGASSRTVWAPATLQALAEVTHQREKADVTSYTSTKKLAPENTIKPMSRRAALAHARQAMAAAQESEARATRQDERPAEVVNAIRSYLPRLPNRPTWEANQTLADALVLAYEPGDAANTKKVCSHVAVFLSWFVAWDGRPSTTQVIEPEELFVPGVVEAFLASYGTERRSKATVRSTMRRAIGSLDPAGRPAKVSRPPVAGPYSYEECRLLILLAKNQPTDAATKRICLLVGLPLGAGLDAGDIRNLTASSFAEVEVAGVTTLMVAVDNGRRSRTVPVRHDMASLVRTALRIHAASGHEPSAPLLGRVPDRTNIVPTQGRAPATAGEAAPAISIVQLRNTWLVAAMCSPISLADLLKAAGFATPRTLTDLIPHCPLQDPAVVAQTLSNLRASVGAGR